MIHFWTAFKHCGLCKFLLQCDIYKNEIFQPIFCSTVLFPRLFFLAFHPFFSTLPYYVFKIFEEHLLSLVFCLRLANRFLGAKIQKGFALQLWLCCALSSTRFQTFNGSLFQTKFSPKAPFFHGQNPFILQNTKSLNDNGR